MQGEGSTWARSAWEPAVAGRAVSRSDGSPEHSECRLATVGTGARVCKALGDEEAKVPYLPQITGTRENRAAGHRTGAHPSKRCATTGLAPHPKGQDSRQWGHRQAAGPGGARISGIDSLGRNTDQTDPNGLFVHFMDNTVKSM